MHQNQWLAAIRELEADGLEASPVPSCFPQDLERREVAYTFVTASDGQDGGAGGWASGPSPDGRGQFSTEPITAMGGDDGRLSQVDPRTYGTPAMPVKPSAS